VSEDEVLQRLLDEGVAQGVYTAAATLVGLKGELRWQGAAGRLSRDPAAPAATLETVFDLASFTKPLATALALLRLIAQDKLTLDTTLGEVLSRDWLPPDKKPLSLLDLLTHRAGLPAWRPFYQKILAAPLKDRPGLLERLAAAAPLDSPGETRYSDLGFMLLKAVVEQLAGEGLDAFCCREIYRPLSLATLGFNPLKQPGGGALAFAATEAGLIPGRHIFGEVHDENAWAAGGVAGHAGLFGTGREIFQLLGSLWAAYHGEKDSPFPRDLSRLFLTPVPGAGRALGFDTPAGDAGGAAGRYFSPASVGHLGFTGTSFWLDLKSGQMVVLLTNRVHLGRDHLAGIRAFRPRFHEAASRALGFSQAFRG
jgi:CubicO group peptidase (beta-lactamase class C family)